MHINFIFSKDAEEIRTIYVWNDNDNVWCSGTIFESFLNNYQKGLQIIKGSDFKFESVDPLDYHLHKVSLKRGLSYIKSLERLVNKRAAINEKDDKGLQYTLTLALYYNKIKKKELKNIFKKIKHVDFPSHQKDWKIFEQNESIALDVLFSQNSEEITLVYESKHNFKQENNVILLMINDDDNAEKYYFAVKNKTIILF